MAISSVRSHHDDQMQRIDPIAMEVFASRLRGIIDSVALNMIRSSFSTSIKERRDCSVGLFDKDGRLVCQADYVPMLLSGVMGGVESLISSWDPADIEPGDAFICNDPYLAGGTHSSDISILSPVFFGGEIAFFIGNIGHHSDVGGVIPGSTDHSLTSVFAEGIRIPLTKIVRRGRVDEGVLELIAHNTRDYDERVLDIRGQIAANERGADALGVLVDKTGLDEIKRVIDDLVTYSEVRMRKQIARIPDGDYESAAFTDDEGTPGDSLKLSVLIKVLGDRMELDFSGSDRQARGAINVAWYPLIAASFCALKIALDPKIETNAGMFRPVTVSVKEGTILSPRFPAAIGNREYTCQRVVRAILVALQPVAPVSTVPAPSADINTGMAFSGPRRDGGHFVYVEAVAGGTGATAAVDGMHGTQVHITNTANTPVEALEIEFPLLVREYALAEDSVGPGRNQGGAGIVRQIAAWGEGVTATVKADGCISPALGVEGGGAGGRASLSIVIDDEKKPCAGNYVVDVPLKKGDSIELRTPGGGGFGDAALRPRDAVEKDLGDDLVSIEFVQSNYLQRANGT